MTTYQMNLILAGSIRWTVPWTPGSSAVSSVPDPDPNPDPPDPLVFGLPNPDPDPLFRGMDPDPALDPDPSIIMQK